MWSVSLVIESCNFVALYHSLSVERTGVTEKGKHKKNQARGPRFRKPAILFLFAGLLASACNEQKDIPTLDVKILSPPEGSFLHPGEALRITVEMLQNQGEASMHIYQDGELIAINDKTSLDTLMALPPHPGIHTLRVEVRTDGIPVGESQSSYTLLEDAGGEWFLSGWTYAGEIPDRAADAIESLQGGGQAILCRHLPEPGSVIFRTGNAQGKLEFLVDGVLKSRRFGAVSGDRFAFYLDSGRHVFKWIAREGGIRVDQLHLYPGREMHTPGEYYGGGIVYHVDSSGKEGLIAAREDGQYDGIREMPWGCRDLPITTGTQAKSRTDGMGNTLAISEDCDWEQTAARYCLDLEISEGGRVYDDWYLPAIAELSRLYENRDAVGNLFGKYYWSSSSRSNHGAQVINFQDGSFHGANRNIPLEAGPISAEILVRPVRSLAGDQGYK